MWRTLNILDQYVVKPAALPVHVLCAMAHTAKKGKNAILNKSFVPWDKRQGQSKQKDHASAESFVLKDTVVCVPC